MMYRKAAASYVISGSVQKPLVSQVPAHMVSLQQGFGKLLL